MASTTGSQENRSHRAPQRGGKRTPIEMPLRIAFVVHTFEMGGLERCVSRLLNHMDREKYQPSLICLDRSGDARKWLNVVDVPIIELHKRPRNELRIVRRLASELTRLDVQMIHSHNWGTLVETTLARKISGTPIHVHAERGMEFSDKHNGGLRAWMRYRATCWALNRTDAVVAVADTVRERLLAHCGNLHPNVVVVPNGVDVPPSGMDGKTRGDILDECGIPRDALVLGSVGRLAAVKDFGVAIEAVAALKRGGCNTHLLLVGDGPERQQLADLATSHGCSDRIHLAGQRNDIGSWYRAMDVYLNVSRSEGMSQAILEAMSLGLPMVVTDVGANRSLTGGDNECGLVVPPRDPAGVEAAVARLADDPHYRRQLSENGIQRYKSQYSVKEMVKTYDQLYMGLATNGTVHT